MDSVTCEGDAFPFHYKYPRPAVTTDCVIFGYDGGALRVLLVRRGRDPYKGLWAFPGGFLEMDESAGQGAFAVCDGFYLVPEKPSSSEDL